MSLSVLRSCASCAELTDSKLRCTRCHTNYCSSACQVAHWKSGVHKKVCKGIARARRDTDPKVQLRALAHVSQMSVGAPNDACCLFCLDAGDDAKPLMRGCACRGTFGWSHMDCLIKSSETRQAPKPPAPHFAAWVYCSVCKQCFTGHVKLRLAIVLWAKHAHNVETDEERCAAMSLYAVALAEASEYVEAVRLGRVLMDVYGPEHYNALVCASNIATSLAQLGEYKEAVTILRTSLTAMTCTCGPDDNGTLAMKAHLIATLIEFGAHSEAEALAREALENMGRILGRHHRVTLDTTQRLAQALAAQRKYVEAVKIGREVFASKTRLLGAENETVLVMASNLAGYLMKCGQNAEAGQLLDTTLTMARRALGPTHEQTKILLNNMRLLGFPV